MSVFKKEDKVFHPSTGWGVIKDFNKNFSGDPMVYVYAPAKARWVFESELSFTEYTIEMKGFSQERPGHKNDTMLCVIEDLILCFPHTRDVYCLINKSDYLSIVSSVISRRGVMMSRIGEDGFSNDYKDFTYNDERYTVHFMCSDFVKSGEFKLLKNI